MSPGSTASALRHSLGNALSGEDPLPSIVHVLMGVDAAEARWEPKPGVATIWEIVAHAAEWLELLIADLTGLPKRRVREWPRIIGRDEDAWEQQLTRLRESVDTFSQLISGLTADELYEVRPGHRIRRLDHILRAMAFCAYNAGKIAKLRTLYEHHRPVVAK